MTGSVDGAQSGRSLIDRIRNPSPAGLVAALLGSFVPLAWPLLLYMVLRYATGHRAPRAEGEPLGPQQWLGGPRPEAPPNAIAARQPTFWAAPAPAGRSLLRRIGFGFLLVILVGTGVSAALLVMRGYPAVPSPPATSGNIPPAGEIWFGGSYDATTFELQGRTSSVGISQRFAVVAQLTHSMNARDLLLHITLDGALVANNRVNATGSGEVWSFSTGPLVQAGSWHYDLTDVGGNVLASGTVTAK